MSVQDFLGVMTSGGSLIISAKGIEEQDLRLLATSAKQRGVQLLVKGVGAIQEQILRGIAKSGEGHVTFDFTA